MKPAAAVLVAVALAAAFVLPARAASFDCAKAASRVEKSICADPALGALDERVAAAWRALDAGLDAAMRPRLLRSQREWLASRPPGRGLAASLKARLGVLQGARVTLGTVSFLRLADASRPMFVLDARPGAAAYNAWVDSVWAASVGQTTQLREDGPACASGDDADCEADSTARRYVTTVPSAALVSVEETVVSYEQGAAHPEVDLHHENWWLARSGRVRVDDIFAGAGWKPVVARAARAYAKKANELVEVGQDAIDGVSTVDDWALTADALVFSIDGYSFNLGRREDEVAVPWRDFGAAVRPDFAAALKPAP